MNKTINKILFALFVLSILLSCDDNEDFQIPHNEKVSVEFDTTQVMIHENEELQIIQLSFKKPALKNGLLTLSVSNTVQSRFTVEPALLNGKISLSVLKGQHSAIIKIKPENNSLEDGNLEFTLTISETSADFIIGTNESISIRLLDDDITAPGKQSVANFIVTDKIVLENSKEGKTCSIQLSELLAAPGSIEISLESPHAIYGTHFYTIPAATSGRVILSPVTGEGQTGLTVIPIDNSIINGELEIFLEITGTTGPIIMGTEVNQAVSIIDDELINKPKGYELNGGGWRLKKIYEYDEQGRVKYINTEKSTPATSTKRETYIYDTDGRIQRINSYPRIDRVFTWSDNRITKSESIDNGIVNEYVLYDYDANGNISGEAVYFRYPDGQFKLGFLTAYLYFLDGNLFKSLTYTPNEGSDEYTLKSTGTYDQYIDAANPFPMVEILPTVKTQTKLPSIYILEENGVTLNYRLTYEFREDGLVYSRIANNGNMSETALYLYY
jgi:hypothetical protein